MKQNNKFILVIVISILIGSSFGFLISQKIAYSSEGRGENQNNLLANLSQNTNNIFNFKKLIPQWFKEETTSPTPTASPTPTTYSSEVEYEQKIIDVVEKSSNAVVSIIITKDVPIIEQYYTNPFEGIPPEIQQFFWPFFRFESPQIPQYRQKGTEKQEVGGGTGFIVSSDGLILTNKHVVSDKEAEYTVFLNNGEKYQAKILAQDPIDDIALIKIEANNLPVLTLGNSESIKLGQTVIAIGNALGEFRNTISLGVVSGLARSVTATDSSGNIETIDNVIQTDAAINFGNSGGPLINLKGEVIGINTAIASGAENIGFAIPINRAKKDIESYQSLGKIASPFIGIRYTIITPALKEQKNLPVDYGALISSGNSNEPAVLSNSPAEKAGLKEGDIILEFDGKKINSTNSISSLIKNYKIGDKINLKVLRGQEELNLELILTERPEDIE